MVNRLKSLFQKYAVCAAAFIYVLLLCTGAAAGTGRNVLYTLIPQSVITQLCGRIVSNPVKTGEGRTYSCIVEVVSAGGTVPGSVSKITSEAKGRVQVYIPSDIIEAFYPGKRYSLYAARKTEHAVPILAEAGAMFDFEVIPFSENTGTLPSYIVQNAVYLGFGHSRFAGIRKLRALLRLKLKHLLYVWGDAGGLLLALFSGSAEYTDTGIKTAFRRAGAAHILALSGMHLSLFSGITAKTAALAGGKKFSVLCSLTAVILFVWFAGLTPSLLRALICTLLGTVSALCGLKPDMLKILAASFFIHISIAPQNLYSVSFQLSYAALAGIITLNKLFEPALCRLFPKSAAAALSTSLSAQIGAVPVSVAAFNCITPAGMISSVIITPLVFFFLAAGFICIIISFIIPAFSIPLGGIINLLYTSIVWAVLLFSGIPPLEL